MKGTLEIRNNLFARTGVIGRMAFLRNISTIFTTFIFFTNTFATALSMSYLVFINSFKRLRDIRGTTEGEIPYQAALAILMLILYEK